MGRPVIPDFIRLSAAAAMALALAACTSTYGTGTSPEMALFKEMTGGFLSPKEQPIDYKKRAPLVMPPAAGQGQLPAPSQVADAATAEWPVDPDQTVAGRKEYGSDNAREDIDQAEYRRLKPLTGAVANARGPYEESFRPAYDIVHNKSQREQFKKALADSKGYGRKERKFLTDPPTTYREPAPTAPTFEEEGGSGGFFLTRWITGGSGI